MMVDRVAPHIVQIEKLSASASIQDRVHEPDVVADLRITWEVRKIMRGILQQEWHTITALDFAAARRDQFCGFDSRRDRQWHPRVDRMRISTGNGLKAEMLAVPTKWPLR